MNDTPKPIVLRDLPLAARLTLSVFLLSVGLGYFSALVQLHFQHSSRQGEPLPSIDDIVEHFSGVENWSHNKVKQDDQRPISKLERLIMGNEEKGLFGRDNMGPVFFKKDPSYVKKIEANPGAEGELHQFREGERLTIKAWINSPADQREKAFKEDAFPITEALNGQPITPAYLKDGKIKIAKIFADRCNRCHEDPGLEGKVGLVEYADFEKYLELPKIGGKSTKQCGVERLTQSTHAHLLSFSILWMCTGLIFAFSSYPAWVRFILSPIVLIAQVADVSCWWLARIDGVGPYFAVSIMGTGAIVGLGLTLQIVLSLFNMYGLKGKGVLILLFLGAGFGSFILYNNVIEPTLAVERALVAK